MSYAVIRRLLETRVNALSTGFPTSWENVPYTPIAGTAWQRVSVLPARSDAPTMGDGFRRDPGLLEIMLFYPKNNGSQAATARAAVLLNGFVRGTVMVEGTLRVLVDEHPFISASPKDDSWFVVPVNIPYSADTHS